MSVTLLGMLDLLRPLAGCSLALLGLSCSSAGDASGVPVGSAGSAGMGHATGGSHNSSENPDGGLPAQGGAPNLNQVPDAGTVTGGGLGPVGGASSQGGTPGVEGTPPWEVLTTVPAPIWRPGLGSDGFIYYTTQADAGQYTTANTWTLNRVSITGGDAEVIVSAEKPLEFFAADATTVYLFEHQSWDDVGNTWSQVLQRVPLDTLVAEEVMTPPSSNGWFTLLGQTDTTLYVSFEDTSWNVSEIHAIAKDPSAYMWGGEVSGIITTGQLISGGVSVVTSHPYQVASVSDADGMPLAAPSTFPDLCWAVFPNPFTEGWLGFCGETEPLDVVSLSSGGSVLETLMPAFIDESSNNYGLVGSTYHTLSFTPWGVSSYDVETFTHYVTDVGGSGPIAVDPSYVYVTSEEAGATTIGRVPLNIP